VSETPGSTVYEQAAFEPEQRVGIGVPIIGTKKKKTIAVMMSVTVIRPSSNFLSNPIAGQRMPFLTIPLICQEAEACRQSLSLIKP
jgi:hypothetical protein